MINFNGTLLENNTILSTENRGYAYGDALFETIKVVHGKILFWEDHYFRLMASMRIMRMEIPMNFTMEYLEDAMQLLAIQGPGAAEAVKKILPFGFQLEKMAFMTGADATLDGVEGCRITRYVFHSHSCRFMCANEIYY